MSEPYIGQIGMFGGNFAPRGWAFCSGQLMPIAQNTALFAILGTTYGGDGRTTFGLPDLRGRAPMHHGNSTGPGLSSHSLGQKAGDETVTLTQGQLASHTHALQAADEDAAQTDPTGRVYAIADDDLYHASGTMVDMSEETTTSIGGGQAHTNMQPYLVINFIICVQGLFPSRN